MLGSRSRFLGLAAVAVTAYLAGHRSGRVAGHIEAAAAVIAQAAQAADQLRAQVDAQGGTTTEGVQRARRCRRGRRVAGRRG